MKKIDYKHIFIVFTTVLLSVILTIYAFVNFNNSFREYEIKEIQKRLKYAASNNAQQVMQQFKIRINALDTLANFLEENDLTNNQIVSLLKLVRGSTTYENIIYSTIDGKAVDANNTKYNITNTEYLKRAKTEKLIISEIIKLNEYPYNEIQVISLPIKRNGNIIGVVLGIVSINQLSSEISTQYTDDNYIQIIDSSGNYISLTNQNSRSKIHHKNIWEEFQKYEFTENNIYKISADILNYRSGYLEFSYQGKSNIAYYTPLGIENWYIFSTTSKKNIDDYITIVTNYVYKFFILILLSFLLELFLFLYLTKRSNKALVKAHQETRKNEELLQIAIAESNNIYFEYNQHDKTIVFKGKLPYFQNEDIIYDVPNSMLDKNVLHEKSWEECKNLFEEIKKNPSVSKNMKFIIDNKEYWYKVTLKNLYAKNDEIINTIGLMQNINEQYQQKLELEEKSHIQEKLIANALMTCKINLKQQLVEDIDGVYLDTPIKYNEYLKKYILDKIVDNEYKAIFSNISLSYLLKEYNAGKDMIETTFKMNFNGEAIWVSCIYYILAKENQNDLYAMMILSDINEQKCKELQLTQLAERDGLTGLFNAETIKKKVNDYLQSTQSLEKFNILILLDLDNFKAINDTFGHLYGDKVLIDVANILNNKFRSNDLVARLGGDEFVVMLINVTHSADVERIYQELVKELNIVYTKDGNTVEISSSLGIAIAPMHGNTFNELYEKADLMLYEIKRNNKCGYKIYDLN